MPKYFSVRKHETFRNRLLREQHSSRSGSSRGIPQWVFLSLHLKTTAQREEENTWPPLGAKTLLCLNIAKWSTTAAPVGGQHQLGAICPSHQRWAIERNRLPKWQHGPLYRKWLRCSTFLLFLHPIKVGTIGRVPNPGLKLSSGNIKKKHMAEASSKQVCFLDTHNSTGDDGQLVFPLPRSDGPCAHLLRT